MRAPRRSTSTRVTNRGRTRWALLRSAKSSKAWTWWTNSTLATPNSPAAACAQAIRASSSRKATRTSTASSLFLTNLYAPKSSKRHESRRIEHREGEFMRTRINRAVSATLFAVVGMTAPLHSAPPPSPRFAALQAPDTPGSFLDVDGGKLYYEECGTGSEAVLLVHDGVLHSAVWDDVWGAFCKDFHTIRYDRRGYGRSPATTKWYRETDDMYALLRHLKISRTMVVGSSHGGELSIEFTIEHPSMVEELVLVGAVVHGYPYSAHFMERVEGLMKPLEKNDVAGA